MRKHAFSERDMSGVFAVPSLARRNDPNRTVDIAANQRVVDHIARGGITRLIYGGNACLQQVTLAEYEQLLEWLARLSDDLLCIPSAGPSFGRAMDQAPLLRRHGFPVVMMLPNSDPRDALGMEAGIQEFVAAAGMPVMVYLNDEANFGVNRDDGLDAIARLVDSNACVAVKYAVARMDPVDDPYLADLLRRVERKKVGSGMGERPAVVHLRDWKIAGYTSGLACIVPQLGQALFTSCLSGDYSRAEEIRRRFLPLEDLRDAWGASRVLQAAIELAGIATTGSVPPFQSPLGAGRIPELLKAVQALQKDAAGASIASR